MSRRTKMNIALAAAMCVVSQTSHAAANLIRNPGFETGNSGRIANWQTWSRERGKVLFARDAQIAYAGKCSLKIESNSRRDWSVSQGPIVTVRPFDVFRLTAWMRCEGVAGRAGISVVVRGKGGRVLHWVFAPKATSGTHDWRNLSTRIVVPRDAATIEPRITGRGKGRLWVDDVALYKERSLSADLRRYRGPSAATLSNDLIEVRWRTPHGTFSVLDKRTRHVWSQTVLNESIFVTSLKTSSARRAEMGLLDATTGVKLAAAVELADREPEFTLTLSGEGEFQGLVGYPHPFVVPNDGAWVVPMNEGVRWPVRDGSIPTARLPAFSGHGLAMAWFGASAKVGGLEVVLETPDDLWVQSRRTPDAGLVMSCQWLPSFGKWRYARRVRFWFTDRVGCVPLAKYYRRYVRHRGMLKTLAEKRAENPNVDRLIGAPDAWGWGPPSARLAVAKELHRAGVQRLLFANARDLSPEQQQALIDLGYLTSRYQSFRTIWPPDAIKALGRKPEDWWWNPKDIALRQDGSRERGWVVKRGGKAYPGYTVCAIRQVARARQVVPPDLKANRYLGRFIDTTTAAPLVECWSPDHSTTRTENKQWKYKLLEFMSKESKLVTGSETGIDWANPVVHYYEGTLSLTRYRLPDAGRDLLKYKKPTPLFKRFQVSPVYRLPLWELVYHDCVVAYWYWGDSSNKAPEYWDVRDLLNVLYATPPLWTINAKIWRRYRDRFIESYQRVCPFVRRVGYQEMTDYRVLTEDRMVQQAFFANGVSVIVNFRARPFETEAGKRVPAKGVLVIGE